ncbi:unnamed protein product [Cylindrotheca closterium]|uniref:Uncharacterized protein n=1 Tax=Cylindrotheca closterium TaxID=2856 RepID=A0AAD2JQ42_9STRA|nr:unnamed protein product [Cylindrotheca closterium]
MSIRLQGGRSTTPYAKGKSHHTTTVLKLLFLALVFLTIIGILKSPNLRLVSLSYDYSQLEDIPHIGRIMKAEETTVTNTATTNNKEPETMIQSVDDSSLSVIANQHPIPSNTRKAHDTASRIETLALLYPPGLIGGYRNQVMRFTSFVRHAIQEQIPQMLLPSIYFSTTYEKDTTERIFYPIRMKDVFDVEYWNEHASHNKLPLLVESISDDDNADCWSTSHDPSYSDNNSTTFASTIQEYSKALDPTSPSDRTPPMVLELAKRGEFLKPLRKLSLAITSGRAILKRPRKVGVIPLDLHCQHPKVYGGGKGGGGILWNDFLYKIRKEVNSTVVHSVSQALIPANQWRDVAHQCIRQGKEGHRQQSLNDAESREPYFALHTRVELEMMRHMCGKHMEMNLTKIFDMVDEFIGNYNKDATTEKHVERMFMAVSRQGMEEAIGKNRTEHERLANENLDTLAWRMAEGQDPHSEKTTIVECGESWMKRWYSKQDQVEDNYYGTLIPMVMNFYIATEAEVFIGTKGSSWSTDVWTTRYYQGKGDRNFKYTMEGIIPIPNGGLPMPHGNC